MTGTKCARRRRGELQAVMGIPADSRYLARTGCSASPSSVPNVIVSRRDSPAPLGLSDRRASGVLSDPERAWLCAAAGTAGPDHRSAQRGTGPAAPDQWRRRRSYRQSGRGGPPAAATASRGACRYAPGRLQRSAGAGCRASPCRPGHHLRPPAAADDPTQARSPARRLGYRRIPQRPRVDPHVARWGVPLLLVLLTALLVHAIGHYALRREVAGRRHLNSAWPKSTDNPPAVVYQARRAADGTLSFPFIAGDLQALFGISRQQAEQDATCCLERIEEDDREHILHAWSSRRRGSSRRSFLEFRLRPEGTGARWCSQAHPYAAEVAR